jgi:hypothetical protein
MKAPFRSTPSPRLLCCLVLTLIAFALLASVPAAAATHGAGFTTFDTTLQGCLDGSHPNGIDCNNYGAKEDVYINGGPTAGGISDGTYFFAVVAPGFQNGGFLDGADGNLSDTNPSNGGPGGGDDVTNRIFTVTNHVISYSGTHAIGTDPGQNLVVALFPYDNTPNNGGVYILAICPVGAIDPRACKYDAFRINVGGGVCTVDCGGPATLTVCKFWDQNDNHMADDEPLLGNWPITASNVDGFSDTTTQNTGNLVIDGVASPDLGCTSFTVTIPPGSASVDVTLTEGNLPGTGSQYCDHTGCPVPTPNPTGPWTQTAPYHFTNNVVLASETVTVLPGDVKTADPFGNVTGFDLTVSKTATPSFTRTYTWNITKDVDKTLIETTGTTATFNYTVVSSETGFTDSAWQVAGNITVTNTNAFAVSGVTVTDAVDDGGSCSITDAAGGANETVPAATTLGPGTLVVPYKCTYTLATSTPADGTNTATATWDKTKYSTPDGSQFGQAAVVFSTASPTATVNKTIHVTDSYAGALGTCTASDTTPFASCTFKYQRIITVKPGCYKYDNTATITETGQTASQTVEVCGPAATGALTMGFWQNKNGQGIISGGKATSGVCNSGTWLRQYAPFQDLSATATCNQVATYVYNVIKAATCSGTTQPCNAMLKAQMLATALDVYFSDSSLGGNKIGAPGAIGPVKIDLTKICSMIDGSGGTATCSGTFLNCSSAFGGATCLSVADILTYAASQSNAGGSLWYGNIKATQVLAKNVFDAINNRVAFNCP